MNKSLVALFALALIPMAFTVGCSTLTESPAERAHNIGQVVHYNQLEFNEDLDDFLLEDRPSRLTYWIIRYNPDSPNHLGSNKVGRVLKAPARANKPPVTPNKAGFETSPIHLPIPT